MPLLINLLIMVVIIGLLAYCVSLLPLPAPWKTIAQVVFVIIAIILLLGMLPAGPYHLWR